MLRCAISTQRRTAFSTEQASAACRLTLSLGGARPVLEWSRWSAMLVVETIAGMTYGPWHYVPVLDRKSGASSNGAPFKDLVLPAAIDRIPRRLATI